ncbi:MAG: pyridoxamine 5'-phosphate oxidase [Flavobacteriaceae bacterium]|nr:pyridoxamine 5'-phosphate oxidase [Flavobacteriaceae bacterium]
MKKDLSYMRKDYNRFELLEKDLPENPLQLFHHWFEDAKKDELILEPNAATLSTSDAKSRVVLLKEFNPEGFVFYTNYTSAKAKALAIDPRCSFNFFWLSLQRQVLIFGNAEKVASAVSDAYFKTRPRESQLGAWVSDQSSVIPNRTVLEERWQALENEFKNREIPRPKHWGGYLIRPLSIEFWQGRSGRLHDRILYEWINDNWAHNRLAP